VVYPLYLSDEQFLKALNLDEFSPEPLMEISDCEKLYGFLCCPKMRDEIFPKNYFGKISSDRH